MARSLRARVLLLTVVLLAAGLAASDVLVLGTVRAQLVQRIDLRLHHFGGLLAGRIAAGQTLEATTGRLSAPSQFAVGLAGADGTVRLRVDQPLASGGDPRPRLPRLTAGQLAGTGRQLFDVPGAGGGGWRVLVVPVPPAQGAHVSVVPASRAAAARRTASPSGAATASGRAAGLPATASRSPGGTQGRPTASPSGAATASGRAAGLPAASGSAAARPAASPSSPRSAEGPAGGRTAGRPVAVVLAVSLDGVSALVAELGRAFLLIGFAVLALLGLGGWFAVRAGLRPLRRMESAAARIAAERAFDRRMPETSPGTEVGRLSAALDTMLAELEAAFAARAESEARMRRFVADASHELRTPLVGIRGFAELYRMGGLRGPEEVRRTMSRIESEALRLSGLVEDLLTLARLDEARPLRPAPMDLRTLAVDALHDLRALDPGRPVELTGPDGGRPGPARVLGEEARLRQVVANLVGNAVAHTPPGTPVRIGVGSRDGWGILEVADRGPGLSAEQAARVFERFYRADPSRSRPPAAASGTMRSVAAVGSAGKNGVGQEDRGTDGVRREDPGQDRVRRERRGQNGPGQALPGPDSAGPACDADHARAGRGGLAGAGGAGLGLAIAAALVAAHEGRIDLVTAPDQGCCFRVRLPQAAVGSTSAG